MNLKCPFCAADLQFERSVQRPRDLFACSECFNPMLLESGTGGVTAAMVPGAQDMRGLMGDESIAGRLLSRVRSTIDELPILPEMSHRIVTLCGDENASIQDIAKLVSNEPVVSSRVIQVANSAYYRGLSEITDIASACARLGLRTVANTVQSVAMNNVFKSSNQRYTDAMNVLWRHSVAVAHLSSEIAVLLSMPHSELVYLMGLLHDIGKIGIVKAISESDASGAEAIPANEELFDEMLGRFHTVVGLHTGLRWNLPADLVVAIYFHHTPDAAPSEQWRRMAHVVNLADSIAHVTNFPSERTRDVALITSPSAAFFSLSDVKLAALRVDLEDRMEAFLAATAA